MNVENNWDGALESDAVEGPAEHITQTEVERAMKQMKTGKAGGPTGVVSELLRASGAVWCRSYDDTVQHGCERWTDARRLGTEHLDPYFQGKG